MNNYFNIIQNCSDEKVCLIHGDTELPYSELKYLCDNIAKLIEPRSLAFLVSSNTIESVAIYLSSLMNGFVCLLLPESLTSENLKKLSDTFKPKYIFCRNASSLKAFDHQIIHKRFKEYIIFNSNRDSPKLHSDLALLLTTSGSTGSPKLVKLTYKNLQSNTAAISEYLPVMSDDQHLTTLPMCYTYGLSGINIHLSNNASIVLTDYSLVDKRLWDIYNKTSITTISGVPYTYEILAKLKFKPIKNSSLRYITQAGGKLTSKIRAALVEFCKEENIPLYIMYGQTEATARMSYLPPDMVSNKVDSIGVAIPNGKFSLNNINQDGIGDLIYHGENVCMGYANEASDLAEGNINNDTLNTGDLAFKDNDNYYYLKGRKNRFAKIFGLRIDLDYLQEKCRDDEYECVITSNDEKIFIHLEDIKEVTNINNLKTLATDLTTLASKYIVIKGIEKIPRSPSGKIIYSQISSDD